WAVLLTTLGGTNQRPWNEVRRRQFSCSGSRPPFGRTRPVASRSQGCPVVAAVSAATIKKSTRHACRHRTDASLFTDQRLGSSRPSIYKFKDETYNNV